MGILVLYGLDASPPVRACKLTLHALDLQYEFKFVNLLANEQKTEEFLSMNPQHTIPLLKDDDKYIWDSHAICAYLVRKYANNDTLYPRDYYLRAVTDQRLHFESGVLFARLCTISKPLLYHNVSEIPRMWIDEVYEAYDFLECFLNQQPQHSFIAGPHLTIADFSCLSTVSSLLGVAPVQPLRYPKVTAWLAGMHKLPYYQHANGNGAQILIDMLKSKITKIV